MSLIKIRNSKGPKIEPWGTAADRVARRFGDSDGLSCDHYQVFCKVCRKLIQVG